ncbi:hypothetical protein ANCDUO_03453 [Ancylostoma duodenale]|uniref:Uncharacterized protein n=1 Tax=Ancylostoma duodenale TaxID=51022 RepID=A0A0C2H3U4_9BILA|nr:hypothetical protein ANCDUO_03453 [Ancylostoma duodenale]
MKEDEVVHGQAGTRSRRQTSSRPERTKRNGQKSGSELSESPDDWRMVNYTFQEVTHYPVLIQINQQMQMLSRQLYEIESTNSLQLKIIAQLLNKLIKASSPTTILHPVTTSPIPPSAILHTCLAIRRSYIVQIL